MKKVLSLSLLIAITIQSVYSRPNLTSPDPKPSYNDVMADVIMPVLAVAGIARIIYCAVTGQDEKSRTLRYYKEKGYTVTRTNYYRGSSIYKCTKGKTTVILGFVGIELVSKHTI